MKTKEEKRLYAAEYRAKNPPLPKTPEQLEKRRLWQIEYRKTKPAPKPTKAQKERRAQRQLEYRAYLKIRTKEQKELASKAKQARLDAKRELSQRLRAEKKEARRIVNNAKRKPTKAQLGIEVKPRGRKQSIFAKPPTKVKAKLKPMKVSTPKSVGRIFPTLNQDLSTKIKLHIPELRMDVYIRPDQDIDLVRKKYLGNR